MIKVKMCGLKRPEDISYANECRPDYAGFVFAESPRQVNADQAVALAGQLNPAIKKVGVFVNSTIDEILRIAMVTGLDAIQLHGDEDGSYLRELCQADGSYEIWKAVRVQSLEDIKKAETMGAHRLLLDAFCKDAYGGTGNLLQWELLSDYCPAVPFFIAGGLTTDNIRKIVEKTNPYGIDISSGIETNGSKDLEKMKKVMEIMGGIYE